MENTTKTLSFARIQWDHLHIRGEYLYHKSNIVMLTGSPPHTWRILPDEFVLFMNTRITSTYVENTKVFRWRVSFDQDHLHIRGEYDLTQKIPCHKSGSPPHTWRIQTIHLLGHDRSGITSTYVENTKTAIIIDHANKDHLHIRGEYGINTKWLPKSIGSPPHTWRIRKMKNYKSHGAGITSTYVENTKC